MRFYFGREGVSAFFERVGILFWLLLNFEIIAIPSLDQVMCFSHVPSILAFPIQTTFSGICVLLSFRMVSNTFPYCPASSDVRINSIFSSSKRAKMHRNIIFRDRRILMRRGMNVSNHLILQLRDRV